MKQHIQKQKKRREEKSSLCAKSEEKYFQGANVLAIIFKHLLVIATE